MSEQMQLSGPEGLKKIGEIVQGIQIAMLTTVAADGSSECRPMATQQLQNFQGRLWLLTRDETGQIAQIPQNTSVSLVYPENGSSTYLAVKGLANLSEDRMKIQMLWNAMYKDEFPQGPADPSIAVLSVDVTEAEYWQSSVRYIAPAATATTTNTATGKIQVTLPGKASAATIPVGQPTNSNTKTVPVEDRTRQLV